MGRWTAPLAFLFLASAVSAIPNFSKPAYNATIYENSRGKTNLRCPIKMGVQLDPGKKEEYEVRFRIVGGDRDKFFKAEERIVGDFVFLMIRTRTGNTHVLNRERKDRYTLQVKADLLRRGSKPVERDTTVYVSILDKNDLNPLFYPPLYEVVVTEDSKLHTSILKVNAEDADLGINGELYFYFQDKTEQFSIHPTTGVIILTRPLRYAEQSLHKLTVVAKDRGGGKPSYGNVTMHVKQVNLFGPEIYVHPLPAVIENANTDVYAIVRVLDQDEGVHGQIKSLEIVEGDPEGNFNVRQIKTDPKLGYEYHIELLNSLDRETAPRGYNLTLKAIDCGLPSKYTFKTLHVTIADTNDNKPVFDRNFYEVDISENTPPNSPILRMKVNDADLGENGVVVFEITGNNAETLFTINPLTGMIYTTSWLDAEQSGFHTLTVTATDKAVLGTRKQSSTNVKVNIIDANDNDPMFENNEVTVYIDENGSPGTSVTTVSAHDDDSGENSYISYSIANLKTVPFEIDHFSGVVKTTHVIDYESSRRNYVLKIRASDWGLPYRRQTEMQLKIVVKDVNDNRPQFEKTDCVGKVPRLASIGTELLTLSAIDFDAGNIISYRLLSGNDDECFTLDSTRGVILITCDLADVKVSQRELNVTATDGVHFADATSIIIKLLPMSNNLTVDRITFKCKNTGVAHRLTEIMSAAEKNNMNQEEFAMMPSRYGQNAHSPEFINFPVQIIVNESVPIGSVIAAIRANDRDRGYNGELVYGITSGDIDSLFRIDPTSGDIRVIGFLDREREYEYFLNVTVYDLGRPKKSNSKYLPVTILDVNDNPPKFDKTISSFRVTENAINGTVITSVNASDPDSGENGRVSYSIVSDSSEFHIDPKSGVLSVAGLLDHEKRSLHEIVIRATDCAGTGRRDALFSDTVVKVYIDDINDNPPTFSGDKFKVTIPEDLPRGVVIAIISAVDPDLEEGGQIGYSLPDPTEFFEIDRLTGTIRLTKSLDYETSQGYSLTVQAQDMGVPSLSSTTVLTVIVTDVNENEHPPTFSDVVVTSSVKEGEPKGTLVTTVTATDLDPPGRDSTLFYRIVSGDGIGYFSIDEQGTST
ncbi:hypothetical protein GE061_000998 [Apolygus lucorum]|uniref:Cadherin domain-containing protein n=1 Tax=Apolygus lucorum TaxID=248454 RepID=A0A8S9Y5T9_APOLU|nr:hypothetical protein GE061_000998 [Apolygus lucorum]